MVEIKNASRVTQSLTRSHRPQTPQTSDTNLNHEINNKTKQGKTFLEKGPRRYRPYRELHRHETPIRLNMSRYIAIKNWLLI